MAMQMWTQWGNRLLADIDAVALPPASVAVWYLGQMSFVVKGAETVVYLDPYFVESWTTDDAGRQVSRRKFPPPFAGEDVQNADVVLGTHNHSDHINVPTLKGIAAASPKARFIVPKPHRDVLVAAGIAADRTLGAQADVALTLGDLQVIPVAAAHEELEQDAAGDYMALSYVLKLNGVTLFHAGDTVEYPGLAEKVAQFQPDICMLPINGRDLLRQNQRIIGNMNFREAADFGHAVGAKLLVSGHFDVFPHNSENPAYFADYLYRAYPMQPFKIMTPGERMVHMR